MRDEDKTKEQLISELEELRQRLAETALSETECRQPDEALWQSEGKHRVLAESLFDTVYQFDLEGKFVYANEAATRMFGYSMDEILNSIRVNDTIDEKDVVVSRRDIDEILKGKSVVGERTFIRKDGTKFVGEVHSGPVYEGEKIVGVRGVLRDISEHKRMEEVLKESEEKLKTILENTHDVIFQLSLLGIIQYVSPQVKEIYGYNPEDLIGKHFKETTPVSELPKALKVLKSVLSGKKIDNFEIDQVNANGKIVPVEINATPVIKDGKIIGGEGIMRDITKRKQTEHDLNERVKELECLYSIANIVERPGISLNELYQEVTNLLPVSWQYPEIACARIIINDKEFRTINYAETQWKQASSIKVHGVKTGVVEVNYLESRPEIDEGPFLKEERHLIDTVVERLGRITERVLAEEAIVKAKDELEIRVKERTAELAKLNEDLCQEISERKRAEDELRALSRQLVNTQENERRAISRELHDQVGQSLTALGINLNIIQTQIPGKAPDLLQSRMDDSLSLVEQTAERIRDVMANLRPPVLDDYGLVSALRWYGEQFATRTDIAIAVEGEEPVPRLDAQVENALFRIAQEALTNVAKHAQATQVTVTIEVDNGNLRLIVADDGIGFDLANLPSPDVGRGWGLLTMRERAEVLGGVFRIESRPSGGTRLIVEVAR